MLRRPLLEDVTAYDIVLGSEDSWIILVDVHGFARWRAFTDVHLDVDFLGGGHPATLRRRRTLDLAGVVLSRAARISCLVVLLDGASRL